MSYEKADSRFDRMRSKIRPFQLYRTASKAIFLADAISCSRIAPVGNTAENSNQVHLDQDRDQLFIRFHPLRGQYLGAAFGTAPNIPKGGTKIDRLIPI
jgi:hypothetical protein